MSDESKSEELRKERRTWTEELEILGDELVDRIKSLVAEGNVHRLIIRMPHGQVLVEVPLTAGVAVGGVVTLVAPVLAALGALAALIARVKLEVVRIEETATEAQAAPEAEKAPAPEAAAAAPKGPAAADKGAPPPPP